MKKYTPIYAKIILYAILIAIVVVTLLPLVYAFSASFKTNFEIASGSINIIPKEPTFDNLKTVWGMSGSTGFKKVTYADYTLNSLEISLASVVVVVVLTSLSAYCFQRGDFPGRRLIYWLFLGTMFVGAGSITIFPIIQLTSAVGLNNKFGLVLVEAATAGASNLFLTMGYLKTISKDLDEAAKLDGCSFFSTWLRIILPLSKPILATVALMEFIATWNDYLIPMLMLNKHMESTTLIVAVTRLQSAGGAGSSQYNLMMAGAVLTMIPVLVLFLCMNKFFVAGMTAGAVKE